VVSIYDQIKRHEGLRLKPYKCTAGKTTIGYGRNLDDVGISEQIAELMLIDDVMEASVSINNVFEFDINKIREYFPGNSYVALIDMMFNLGETRFRGFNKMIEAVKNGDWEEAARQAEDSKWFSQVGERGKTIVAQLRDAANKS